MTATARPAARPTRTRAAGPVTVPRWVWLGLLALIAVLAFVVRNRLLVQVGGLLGSDAYDDGVYYAAADALVHGRLPYRDFLFLQPPGTVVALTPFAWLGSLTTDPIGVITARLFFEGIGAVNTVLVTVLARRFGLTSAVVAGVTYAVLFPAAYTERSTLLEPLGTLGLLVALLLAERMRTRPGWGITLAGVAAGIAVGMKIWYLVPAVVIGLVHWRRALRYTLGVAIGGVLVYVPFFAAAPAQMFRQVVLDQLGRPRDLAQTPFRRAVSFLGAPNLHLHSPWSVLFSQSKIGLLLVLLVLACTIAAFTVRGARVYPALLLVSALVLMASPSYFLHYGALTGPWIALSLGIGLARLLRPLPRLRPRVVVAGVVVAGLLGLNGAAVIDARSSSPIPVAALRPAAERVQGCVLSDDPQILAALNVLSSDLRRGCPLWPDVTGYTYDRDSFTIAGREVPRPKNPVWQRDVAAYLTSGQAVIVHRAGTGLAPATKRLIRSGRVLAKHGNWVLYAVSH